MTDPLGDAGLTVGRAAALLGVTVRALRHWDEIGLARPSSRTAAGYRVYAERDLERLRRVLVYRELGLDLETVRSILDDPAAGTVEALRDQRERIAERIRRLQALGDDLDRMVAAQERGLLMTSEEQAEAFGPGWDPRWPEDARRRWGDTAQWQQYAERSASRSPEEWQDVTGAITDVERLLADALDRGVRPGTSEAEALVDRHREVFSAFFPLTRSMQVVLGRMFATDPAYAVHFEGIRTGLSGWFRRIIDASARAHGIDPETATWDEPGPGPR